MSRSKVGTVFGELAKKEAEKPGVGKYNITRKQKIMGNYLVKEGKGCMIDEALFKGMSSPSHYDAINLEKIKDRISYTKIYKPGAA